METDIEVERDSGYAAKVGARLRSIRRQKHLSLQDVEAASEQEFKASVLGCLRARRARHLRAALQRLARFYRVPVDQLLPSDDELGLRGPTADDQVVDLTERMRGPRRDDRPVTIDLGAVEQLGGHEGEMLARYLRMIQVQRGDYNGRMLTIRRDDLRAIACILDATPTRCPPGSTAWASAWCAERGADAHDDRERARPGVALRRLPARAVLRGTLRLLRVRHLDRPAPPAARLPRGLPPRRRARRRGGHAAGHQHLRRRGHAVARAARRSGGRARRACPVRPAAR